ncbi:hypothetical protein BT63DRAFT_449831 [Microthyrium microscopicum]|uniref:Uncharacterized protein n=1 Tax=Microthyrium microscopicum TaxID=703497 RepID=A0A6A6URA4_9PEZI|nr:hypothetical protein BT63DRAFT_449831 [Microthyrium microscopicum]
MSLYANTFGGLNAQVDTIDRMARDFRREHGMSPEGAQYAASSQFLIDTIKALMSYANVSPSATTGSSIVENVEGLMFDLSTAPNILHGHDREVYIRVTNHNLQPIASQLINAVPPNVAEQLRRLGIQHGMGRATRDDAHAISRQQSEAGRVAVGSSTGRTHLGSTSGRSRAGTSYSRSSARTDDQRMLEWQDHASTTSRRTSSSRTHGFVEEGSVVSSRAPSQSTRAPTQITRAPSRSSASIYGSRSSSISRDTHHLPSSETVASRVSDQSGTTVTPGIYGGSQVSRSSVPRTSHSRNSHTSSGERDLSELGTISPHDSISVAPTRVSKSGSSSSKSHASKSHVSESHAGKSTSSKSHASELHAGKSSSSKAKSTKSHASQSHARRRSRNDPMLAIQEDQ